MLPLDLEVTQWGVRFADHLRLVAESWESLRAKASEHDASAGRGLSVVIAIQGRRGEARFVLPGEVWSLARDAQGPAGRQRGTGKTAIDGASAEWRDVEAKCRGGGIEAVAKAGRRD